MNKDIFVELTQKLFIENINTINNSIQIEDDIGVILRSHLICEIFIENWICAMCNHNRIFWFKEKDNSDETKIPISFDNKLKMAKTLQLPDWGFRIFKRINTIRNTLAHRIGENLIDPKKLEGMIDIIKKEIEPLSETNFERYGIKLFHLDKSETTLKFTSDLEPRKKLALITYYIIFPLVFYVAKKHQIQLDSFNT